jgi:hypothetical protein
LSAGAVGGGAAAGLVVLTFCAADPNCRQATGNAVNALIDLCMESRSRGERGATGGSSGKRTDNPYKHCRDHPTDPNKIECQDHQTGKWIPKPKPADWGSVKNN